MVLAGLAVAAILFAVTPARMPPIDAGLGPMTVPYLLAFGVVLVPILSDRRDIVANKLDGWAGVGVLVVLMALVGYTLTDLQLLGEYASIRRLPRRVRSVRVLAIRCAIGCLATIAAIMVLRR